MHGAIAEYHGAFGSTHGVHGATTTAPKIQQRQNQQAVRDISKSKNSHAPVVKPQPQPQSYGDDWEEF